MRKAISGITLAILAGLFLAFTVSSGHAENTPDVRITKVGYNAVGTDTISNRNQEVIKIENLSGATVNLTDGWQIRDKWGHTYKFDNTNPNVHLDTLANGQVVELYTGAGNDATIGNVTKLYQNKSFHYLNNHGDYLRLWKVGSTSSDYISWGYYLISG